MFFWKPRPVRPLACGAASPLLNHVAGEFAGRIAGVWPQPHAVFLTAPAVRRHLICLALAHAPPGAAVDAEALLHRPLRRAIPLAVPSPPPGLARALERLGETCWSEADYRTLLRLLADHRLGKEFRHEDWINRDRVRALGLLPEPLLEHRMAGLVKTGPAAALVAEAFAALAARDGGPAALAAAPAWMAAETPAKLYGRIKSDLEPEPAPPPFPGTDRLRPLATKAALIDAAERYRNCLRNHLRWAAEGSSAYYEWIEAPGAVIEIDRSRLFGWSLEQARMGDNKPVVEPLRSAIIAELRSMGVRVGRAMWQLDVALREALEDPSSRPQTPEAAVAELFED